MDEYKKITVNVLSWTYNKTHIKHTILCLTKSKHLRNENLPKGLESLWSFIPALYDLPLIILSAFSGPITPALTQLSRREIIFSNIIPNHALKTHASVKSTKSQNNSPVIRGRPLELNSLTKQWLVNHTNYSVIGAQLISIGLVLDFEILYFRVS